MKTTIATYPVFDANQVLTNDHLNALVDYLEEQGRLTRANLIGVGISCGLELAVDGTVGKAAVAQGCAVSSLGYLLIEAGDVTLTGYREYTLPDRDPYAPFMDGSAQLPLWELFPADEPNVTALGSPTDFLTGKCVLLFLERNQEDLSDCSPNNCDDKGSEVTFTLRRLLAKSADVAEITQKVRDEADMSARLALPDLRLHRFVTPRTHPVSSRDILEAFQDTLSKVSLVTVLKGALDSAYDAFKPVLVKAHPVNPFDGFTTLYGFLQSVPTTPRQVAFMPYYMDLFADLLAAYDEFRKRALEYACLCCPPEEWFPRHVVLGSEYRTGWYPASASCGDCESLRNEVVTLFTRLVEMTRRFRNDPGLPQSAVNPGTDNQIRITPSCVGTAPLSLRCIPYYYDFTGTPPLYRLWNPALTELNRAHHNQAYRFFEYAPPAPSFVTAPLEYDLERFDFFRIEGHLGKDFRGVVSTLNAIRASSGLPFDVVAVRTGAFDESLPVDPAEYGCRFQDLEAAYKMLRGELLCLLTKAMGTLGKHKLITAAAAVLRDAPRATRATPAAIANVVIPQSVTASFMGLSFNEAHARLGVEVGSIAAAVLDHAKYYGPEAPSIVGESAVVNAAMSVMSRLGALAALLVPELFDVDWVELVNGLKRLQQLSESIAQVGGKESTDGTLSFPELSRQVVSVVFACRLEGLLAIRDEYLRRIQQIRKLAYFDGYAQEHPAIQHKAGVPVGGTFVVVYHGGTAGETNRDDTYGSVTGRLAVGTVIADFCLPYQCCSDCAPIQFVIAATSEEPITPPSIRATPNCTNVDSVAQVDITASGGTPPYTVSEEGTELGTTTGELSVSLHAGTHTLQVKDADDVVGAPVTLVVPAHLAAGEITYTDDAAAGKFTASFPITGGTRPYVASVGVVSDNDVVTIERLNSGTAITVTITDVAGCTTTVAIEHEVDTGCGLPCEGKAERSRYPAWAPRPGKTNPYRYRAVTAWKLALSDETGKTIFSRDFADVVGGIFAAQTLITESTYADLMTRVCLEVSTAVDVALPDELGPRAFAIDFDAQAGTLLIDSYACHTFLIEVEFTIFGEGFVRTEQWRYARKEVRVAQKADGRTVSYAMPAFGTIEMNKCTEAIGRDCFVDLQGLNQKTTDNRLELKPSFGNGVNVPHLQFFWRTDSPALTFSNQRDIRLTVTVGTIVQVQLLVIDRETRCWAFMQKAITVGPTLPVITIPAITPGVLPTPIRSKPAGAKRVRATRRQK